MLEFKGKLIVVTGAARGIGKAVALELARRGARVVILDILKHALSQTADELAQAGYQVSHYACDLSSDDSVRHVGEQVIKDTGVPDIIYNNAYYAPHGSIFDAKTSDIAKSFDVSVLGYIRVIQAFLPEMKARKSGWIINTASPIGLTPPQLLAANMMAYSIVKSGDIALSQSLAVALQPYNIGVTVVYPDIVNTEAREATRGTGDSQFEKQLDSMFEGQGVETSQFAPRILDEIQKGGFVANGFKPFYRMLAAFARNGMDPRADYSHILGGELRTIA